MRYGVLQYCPGCRAGLCTIVRGDRQRPIRRQPACRSRRADRRVRPPSNWRPGPNRMGLCEPPPSLSGPRAAAIATQSRPTSQAVWPYFRLSLRLRDVEELLAERGVTVAYETIRARCAKFGAELRRWLAPAPSALRRQMASGRGAAE